VRPDRFMHTILVVMKGEMTSASDELDILRSVEAFDEAWARGDYDAVANLCTDDFTFIGSGEGEESEGPAATGPTMRAVLDGVGRHMVSWSLEFAEPYRVTIHGDTAIVARVGESELVMPGSRRRSRYRVTGVLRRTPDGWRWWLYHGSEAQGW